jgi:5-methylcytosine-specific restriction endonuclease McrA
MVDDPAAPARRRRIPGSVRRAVIERDGRTCRLCGRPVVLRSVRRRRTRVPGNQLTLDHIVPSSHGGAATIDNLRVCCRDCNMRRGAPGGASRR